MTSTHQPQQQQQLPNNSASKQGQLPKMHSWSAIAAIGTSSEGKTKPVKIMPTSTSPLTVGEGVQVGLDLGPVVGEEQQIAKSRGKAANAAVVATASTRADRPSKTHKTEGDRSSNSGDGGNGSNSSSIGKNMISESDASSANEAKLIISRKNPWKIPSADNAEIKATAVDDAVTPTPAESKDMKAPITVKQSLPSSSASSSSKVDNNHKHKTNSGQSLNQPSSNRSNNLGQQNRNNSKSPKSKQQSNKTSLVKQKEAMEQGKQDKVQNTSIVSPQTASSSSESSTQQSQPDSISPRKSQGNKHRNKKEHQNNKNKDRNSKYHHKGAMNRANNNNNNKKDKRNKNNNNNKRKKKTNEDNNNPLRLYKHTGKLPLTQQQITKLKPKAVAQVEYFFSTTELAKNVFVRSYMDCAGFVPFAIVHNFPSISSYQIPYMDLLVAVGDLSRKVEVDLINECVRIKSTSSKAENKNDEEQDAIYKKWLFPNPDGTLGCPRWIKEVEAEEEIQPEGSTDEEEGALSKNSEVLVNGKENVDKKGKLTVGEVDEEDSSSDTSASTSMDSDQQSFSEKQQEHEQQQLMTDVTVTNGQE